MKKEIKKLLAGFLAITVAMSSTGIEALAETRPKAKEQKKIIETNRTVKNEPEKIRELKEERTEKSNTYLLENGMRQMVYYTEPIRYEDEKGNFIDFNPELKESQKEDYLYENTAGDSKQYFPQILDTITPIVMTNKDYKFSFAPVALGEELSDVKLDSMPVEDIYETEKEMDVLASFRAEEKEITYEYQSLQSGVKENIILDRVPDNNIFAFRLKMSGMVAREDDYGNGITFIDEETENIVGGIETPYMNDATGNAYSEDIDYELKQMQSGEENVYILYMHVDKRYLESETRVYPVTIDPTATWTGNSDLADVYVTSGSYASRNFYSNSIKTMEVGKGSNGVSRTLIRASSLTSVFSGKYVESAKLTLYEYGTNPAGVKIQARHLSESFSLGSVTWNNKPAFTSNVYAKPSTVGKSGSAVVFDLTTWAREIARGQISNRGLTIKANSESAGTYCRFYGARTSTTSKRPKIVVNYYDAPTQATSISLAKQHIKAGEGLTISWGGITSRALSYVNYRVYKYNDAAGKLGNIYIDYSTSTKIGTTASGSKNIAAAANWPEGHYVIYIKGVDASGISGTARGIHFYIDRTSPSIYTMSMSPATNSQTYSNNTTPTLSYAVTETYIKDVSYKVNNSAYVSLGTATKGNFNIPASYINKNAVNTIYIKATDWAGNTSTRSTVYYCDATPPVIGELGISPTTTAANRSTKIPQIKWGSIVESRLNSVWCLVNDSELICLGNTVSGSTSLPEELFDKSGDYVLKVFVVDNATNQSSIYMTTYYYITPKDVMLGKYVEATSETSKRTGIKDIYSYMDFATPLGKGNIELTKANLIYQETDGVLANSGTGINITRTYNSMLSHTGSFGVGNVSVMDESISASADEKEIIYMTTEGSIYKCTLTDEGIFKSEESSDFIIKKADYTWAEVESIGSVNTSYVIEEDSGIKSYFDWAGRIVLITDDNGSWTYFNRNELTGYVSEIITDKEEQAACTYIKSNTGEWVVEDLSLSDGTHVKYNYDNKGHLVSVTNKSLNQLAEEHVERVENDIVHSFSYNDVGKMTGITDALGNIYSIEYLGDMAIAVTYPDNHRYGITYGDDNSVITRTSKEGQTLGTASYIFDDTGKVTKYTDEDGNETTYTYVGNNISGETTIVRYNVLENNIIVSKEKEKREGITYDKKGNILSYINEQGYTVSYTYTDEDVVYKNKPMTEVVKDTKGNTVNNISYEYDDKGNVLKVTDHIEKTSKKYVYNTDGSIKQIESTVYSELGSTNGTVSYKENIEYNADGSVNSSDSKSGTVASSVENIYNTYGYLVNVKDEKGNKTEYAYDGFGRVIKVTNTSSKGKTTITESEYNANGSLIKSIDEVGRITEYAYDNCNRIIKETYTAGSEVRIHTTTYGYESIDIHNGTGTDITYANAYVVTVYNTQGKVGSKNYIDSQGRTIRELKDGIYCDYTYDSQGNVYTSYIGGIEEGNVSGGRLEVYTYDENRNVTATLVNPVYENGTFAVGEATVVTTSEYDKNGNLIKETDGNDNSIQYEYDPQGRVIKVTLNDGTEEAISNLYEYNIKNLDENGKVVSVSDKVTDVLGRVSLTTSNVSGQVLKLEDIATTGNLSITYEYDTSGNKVKETYADGSYISYIYDELSVLKRSEEYNSSSALVKATEYEYDTEYNIICMKNTNGENEPYHYTYYGYDEFGRTSEYAEVNATEGSVSEEAIQAHTIKYTYDIYDRLSRVDYPHDGSSIKGITISYNNHNWVTGINAVIDENGTEVIRKVRTYEFYNDGKIKEIRDYKNFLVEEESYILRSYEYDVLDRVTLMYYTDSSNPDVVYEKHGYTYDKNNNIISETDYLKGESESLIDRTRVHTYDGLNRLISTVETDNTTGNASETLYEYDKVGNRTKVVETGKTTSYTYNELNQVIRADISGSVSGYKTFEYDKRGNQISEYDSLTDTYTLNEYDISNSLIRTREVQGEVVLSEQTNVYDGDGKRISKTENGVTTNYYYEGGLLLYTTDEADNRTSLNITGTESNVIAGVRYDDGESVYFYGKDIKGSTSCITDANGNVVVSYIYDDWGQTIINGDTSFYNQICYTGGVYDELTKLYYLNARYYNPETGSFMSQDTVRGSADDYGTWNLYAYCAGNPVCYVDPSGHTDVAITMGVGWMIAGSVSPGTLIIIGGACIIIGGAYYINQNTDNYVNTQTTYKKAATEKLSEGKDTSKITKKVNGGNKKPPKKNNKINIKKVLDSASKHKKGGETVAGHALQKHAGRNPNIWGRVKGNSAKINNTAMNHIKDILRGPGEFKTVESNGRKFLEKMLKDGRGIRLNMDGTFKGFIDQIR